MQSVGKTHHGGGSLTPPKNHLRGAWQTWIQIPGLPLISCVTLGKSLSLSEPYHLHLLNGDINFLLQNYWYI